jgi:hypothetical protein
MSYDLMLLADPGTERARVLNLLEASPDVRPDSDLETRFWLATDHGEAQINIGSKDPVESIHLEFDTGSQSHMEAVTLRGLELAERLEMRVEDVLWGHEVTRDNLPALRDYWQSLTAKRPNGAASGAEKKPWWRPW